VSERVLVGGGGAWGAFVAGPAAVGVEAASGMEAATWLPDGVGRVSDLLQAARPRAASAQAAAAGMTGFMGRLLERGRG
jgi:hypothetical protein